MKIIPAHIKKLKNIEPNTAIYIENMEESRAVLKELERMGYLWVSGTKPTDSFALEQMSVGNYICLREQGNDKELKRITWASEISDPIKK